ncbi:MAG: hypothetical protein OSB45_00855 [Pseudomonadales bacterium]|nr:hypothetical protein [Pseudomonadales bacterium]
MNITNTLSRKLAPVALALLIVIAVAYLNHMSLLVWAVTNGALGFISRLQEPILPNHEVRWQTSPPACEIAEQRPPNMNQNSGEV